MVLPPKTGFRPCGRAELVLRQARRLHRARNPNAAVLRHSRRCGYCYRRGAVVHRGHHDDTGRSDDCPQSVLARRVQPFISAVLAPLLSAAQGEERFVPRLTGFCESERANLAAEINDVSLADGKRA